MNKTKWGREKKWTSVVCCWRIRERANAVETATHYTALNYQTNRKRLEAHGSSYTAPGIRATETHTCDVISHTYTHKVAYDSRYSRFTGVYGASESALRSRCRIRGYSLFQISCSLCVSCYMLLYYAGLILNKIHTYARTYTVVLFVICDLEISWSKLF